MDATEDENEDQHTFIKKTGAWAFWIGLIAVIVSVIGLLILIGYFYYKIGSVELPPECYISNKDWRTAKKAKRYLTNFEGKKKTMEEFLCKKCLPCKKCPPIEVPKGPATLRLEKLKIPTSTPNVNSNIVIPES